MSEGRCERARDSPDMFEQSLMALDKTLPLMLSLPQQHIHELLCIPYGGQQCLAARCTVKEGVNEIGTLHKVRSRHILFARTAAPCIRTETSLTSTHDSSCDCRPDAAASLACRILLQTPKNHSVVAQT